jgi:hypothetical protein
MISNKKLKQISQSSCVIEILKKYHPHVIGGSHWTDTPPDMWDKHEIELWDILHEVEEALKTKIIKIIK